MLRKTKPTSPTVLQLPESVAAELMRALQPREPFQKSRQMRAVGLLAEQAHQSQAVGSTRRYSTSTLETEDRGFHII